MSNVRFLLATQFAPVYFDIQNSQSISSTDQITDIGVASRRYREIMVVIQGKTKAPELNILIEIWELIEILLIDMRAKGSMIGQLLEDLLLWSSRNNSVKEELEVKALNSQDQFNCPEYWDLLGSYLLTGALSYASELLKHHPDFCETNITLSILNSLIRRRPVVAELGTSADFQAAFDQWQNDVVDSLTEMNFEKYPGAEKIAGILAGDEATLDACLPLVGQWYRLLIAKCYYICPTADPRTMINSSNMETQSKDMVLVDLINRIFELETAQVIRDLVTLNDSWWFVAHNADLLCRLEPENEELKKLRDSCLTNYAESLIENKDTWLIGLKYSATMEDFEKIENEILDFEINSNKEAEKLCSIPGRIGLPNAIFLKNKIASKYANQQLKNGNRGTALCWALKGRDADVCSKIAELELESFHSTEQWSIPALVDAMETNPANIYSEKLLFLSKYKQFYTRVKDKEFYDAAQDLISILAYQMSSEILSIVLKQALLLLDEDFTFSRNHIICIMRALQKQKESSRLANVKLNPTEIEQANLLRKSLAHHLSRSIIQHSN